MHTGIAMSKSLWVWLWHPNCQVFSCITVTQMRCSTRLGFQRWKEHFVPGTLQEWNGTGCPFSICSARASVCPVCNVVVFKSTPLKYLTEACQMSVWSNTPASLDLLVGVFTVSGSSLPDRTLWSFLVFSILWMLSYLWSCAWNGNNARFLCAPFLCYRSRISAFITLSFLNNQQQILSSHTNPVSKITVSLPYILIRLRLLHLLFCISFVQTPRWDHCFQIAPLWRAQFIVGIAFYFHIDVSVLNFP